MKSKQIIEYVETNGVKQYLLHNRSSDSGAPVLLIVHGGPGGPDSNAAHKFKAWWKDLFHLVSWDQRAAGKTLAANGEPPSYPVTVPDILSDMGAIIAHLKESYGAEKVYLLGISWGTLLCSLYTLEHPEDVKMYIAAGQVTNFYRSEQVAYEKVKEAVTAAGDPKDIALLESISPYPELPFGPDSDAVEKKMPVLKRLQVKYGYAMKLTLPLIVAYLFGPASKLSEFSYYSKKNADKRKEYNAELLTYLFDFEILDHGPEYSAPICYITGDRDYTTTSSLAIEYFEKIVAPKKLHCPISGAGHNMMFDQPEAFAQALAKAKALAES